MYPLVPLPALIQSKNGLFQLTPQVKIYSPGLTRPIADYLVAVLAPALGFQLNIMSDEKQPPDSGIFLRLNPAAQAAFGEIQHQAEPSLASEAYHLVISTHAVVLEAPGLPGLFYGVQTLRQLLPAEIYSPVPVQRAWTIPCVAISDKPRFLWRGAMLDSCRHFMPLEFIYKFIDTLALHKLNRFHWHLTDDQGWRIEINRYPRLTEVGAFRKQTLLGHYRENMEQPRYDGIPHGGFYTQAEIRQIVAYAQKRFITVVPEIEMPGHAQAAIAAYPELGNTSQPVEVSQTWGIHEHIFNVNETTFEFLQNVLTEVMDLFPGQYIHIGGDEAPKKEWRASPAAQNRMKELGLTDEDQLQSYFIKRIDAFLTAKGRRLLGWDEILEGGLAPGATVMSWRGEQGGIAAANAGHAVVMASNHYTYLDYLQSTDQENEPLSIGGYIPLEKVYSFEPIPAEIQSAQTQHVLGAQGQLWTEYISTPAQVEYMAFPRLCALAEVVWSPSDVKNFDNFTDRLLVHQERLRHSGVNYRAYKSSHPGLK